MCVLSGNENDSALKDQFLSLDKELRARIFEEGMDNLEIQARLNEFIENRKKDGKEWSLSIEQIRKMAKEEQFLLTITSDGYGKRTSAYEYRITGRGGKGISNINLQPNAKVVTTVLADNSKDIMMIGSKGKIIRIPAEGISLIGRNTKGVRVFNLEQEETVVSVSTVQRKDGDV
jgi:DNA gyrase subunit A